MPNPTELVIDISLWQRKIRAEILRAAGVQLAIIKATQGKTADPVFKKNAQDCQENGLPVAAYHWCDPIEDAESQAWTHLEAVRGLPVRFLAVDVEQWWSNWGDWRMALQRKLEWAAVRTVKRGKLGPHAEKVCSTLRKAGYPVVLYTSRGYVTSYAPEMASWICDYPLWVAAYIQPAGKMTLDWDAFKASWLPKASQSPLLPPGAGRVVGWQFTGDRFILPGTYSDDAGTRRSAADVSVFDAQFLAEVGALGDAYPVLTEKPVGLDQPIGSIVVLARALNVRTGPDTDYTVVGGLRKSDRVQYYAVDGDWVRIGKNRWICLRYGGLELASVCE